MSTAIRIEAYRRLHAEIAHGDHDGASPGVFIAQCVNRLPDGKYDDHLNYQVVIERLIHCLGLPWPEFVDRIQRAFAAAAGDDNAFAAALLVLGDESAGNLEPVPEPSLSRDLVSEVKAMEDDLAELIAAWNVYQSARGDAGIHEGARWMLSCLSRAASYQVSRGLQPAFAWLLAPSNNGQRGRRATALGFAMFGPTIVRNAHGRPCGTLADVAASQGMDETTIRETIKKIPGGDALPFGSGARG